MYCVNVLFIFKDGIVLVLSCMVDYGVFVFFFFVVGGYKGKDYFEVEVLIMMFFFNNYFVGDF